MCYIDYSNNELVVGQTRMMVPIMKRRVSYQKYVEKVDKRSGAVSTYFVGEPTYGWEISKEVPTTKDKEESMRLQYENTFEAFPKTVLVKVEPKPFVRGKDTIQEY